MGICFDYHTDTSRIVVFNSLTISAMDMQQQFITGSHFVTKNRDGNIDTVLAGEKIVLETSVGAMVPRYTIGDSGRKKEAPVKFYKTGQLKSLPLEERTNIETSVGTVKSELLLFYQSGALWRTFPLNGQVSGFWTEENEFGLAQAIDIPTSIGAIKVKPIYLQFYETGELESILFWPSEQITINSHLGEIQVRKGICFHKNGALKGFEPAGEIMVKSPIGHIKAYDPDPSGIHAESHSVNFYEDGSIHSLATAANRIEATDSGQQTKSFAPKTVSSYCKEDAFFVTPLKITFGGETISFANKNEPSVSLSRALAYEVADYIPEKPISKVGCS
jgi:hypothetical protein